MPRTRNPYLADFGDRIIALARAGRSVESHARAFEPCAAIIAGWIKQAGIDGSFRDDRPTSLEREELDTSVVAAGLPPEKWSCLK